MARAREGWDPRPLGRSGAIDALDIIDAAYAPSSELAWLRELATAFAEPDGVAFAYSYRIDPAGKVHLGAIADVGPAPPGWHVTLKEWVRRATPSATRAIYTPAHPVELLVRDAADETVAAEVRAMARQTAIADVLAVRGADPSGCGVLLGQPMRDARPLSPRRRALLTRVALHVNAARRLRDVSVDGRGSIDAVLTPGGRILHVEPEATQTSSRNALADAVRARGAARARGLSTEESLDLWRALVEGEWSLVDHLDTDGKRFVLARRNPVAVRDPKTLSARERDVVALAAMGRSNKLIGYELGIALSTVATHLSQAMRKLRVRTRSELVRLFAVRHDGQAGSA